MQNNLILAAALAGLLLSVSAGAAEQKFLADRHAARGVACESCHTAGKDKAPDTNSCLKCHGGSYKALAKTTENLDVNPHDSHLGEVACDKCHSGHKKPRLVCDQCHEFSMKVP